MITVRVVVDAGGVLASLAMTGHASVEPGGRGISAVCAAVTGIVRACGQAIEREPGIAADGRARYPGEFFVEVRKVPGTSRDWIRGVTDVLLAGVGRIATETPDEVRLIVDKGEGHGS